MDSLPAWVVDVVERVPQDRAVVLLLRHAARAPIPTGETGNELPITTRGRQLAVELGQRIGARLQSLHSSPLLRCTQTAECLRAGSKVECVIEVDRLLGDPGAYVLDADRAWRNWQALGHAGVIEHLVNGEDPLPGMAHPGDAARALVEHMLAITGQRAGIHVFVSHDSIVAPTAARVLGCRLDPEAWPGFLDGPCIWRASPERLAVEYRGVCPHEHRDQPAPY